MPTEHESRALPRIVVAGTHSGVGKTSVVLGLLGALRRRGVHVQGFKVGPDFIDPMYHREVTGAPSYNLDAWLMGQEGVRQAFARVAPPEGVSVIEGVMGMFDGRSTGPEGCTAEVATLVDAPVVLVVDVGGMSRSAAAIVQGYARFDPAVRVAGVLLNRVGGSRHYQLVKRAIEEQAGVPVWGYLPWEDALVLPERHLGLVPVEEEAAFRAICARLGEVATQYLDLDALLTTARAAPALEVSEGSEMPAQPCRARIGIARDAAFNFYYEANLRWLRCSGAELVEFSPLTDPTLPADVDGLYLGGGFPEVFAKQLSYNRSLFASLRQAHRAQMPIYAECGGLMYLVEAIQDQAGDRHPMVGLLPGTCCLTDRLQNFGYKEVVSVRESLLGPAALRIRGHEFHYSRWEGRPVERSLYRARSSHGDEQDEGYSEGPLTASYVHLHFDACPQVALALVDQAAAFRRRRLGGAKEQGRGGEGEQRSRGAEERRGRGAEEQGRRGMTSQLRPEEIQPESFRIIEAEVGPHALSPEVWLVVRRVIHSTGDFEFTRLLRFHPRAFAAAREAIGNGEDILTDVEMVRVGIQGLAKSRHGLQVRCHLNDDSVVQAPRGTGNTRSAQGLLRGLQAGQVGICVVGNAPTALRAAIAACHSSDMPRPKLLIGAPVGFVDAAEAKLALSETDAVPWITCL